MLHTTRLVPIRSLLLGAMLCFPGVAAAGWSLSGTQKVSFEATGTVMDMEGSSDKLRLSETGDQVVFSVAMNTVSTDNDLRDDHMQNKYVEVAKFPDAVVSLPKAEFKLPAAAGEKVKGTVKGTFTVHGVSKPVTVNYSAKRGDSSVKVEASFDFDVNQHGITIPDYMGVTIEPKMKAKASVELIDG
jgi:polyisoprenoid-binding protein YceI